MSAVLPASTAVDMPTTRAGMARRPLDGPTIPAFLDHRPVEETPAPAPAIPATTMNDDLADVLTFVREHASAEPATGAASGGTIRMPLPRVRCIDLLRKLRQLHGEGLHPLRILHARRLPLFAVLDMVTPQDVQDMRLLVEKLRLPHSLLLRLEQHIAAAGLRSVEPWFDDGSGASAAAADAPSLLQEFSDFATTFRDSVFSWWSSAPAPAKKDDGSRSAGPAAGSTAATLAAGTRGAPMRQRLQASPALRPLFDAAVAALPACMASAAEERGAAAGGCATGAITGLAALSAAGAALYADPAFLDGVCGDPFSPAAAPSAAVGAGAAAPTLGAGGEGLSGSSPAARYLAGRFAASHSLPSGVRIDAALARDALPLQALAAAGNAALLRYLLEAGCAYAPAVAAAAARNGQTEVLTFLAAHAAGGEAVPFDESVCAAAAAGGNVEALEWLRAQGCRWDRHTLAAALAAGRKETAEWARSQGCPE